MDDRVTGVHIARRKRLSDLRAQPPRADSALFDAGQVRALAWQFLRTAFAEQQEALRALRAEKGTSAEKNRRIAKRLNLLRPRTKPSDVEVFRRYITLANMYGMEQAIQRLKPAGSTRNAVIKRLKNGRRTYAQELAGQIEEGVGDLGAFVACTPIPRQSDDGVDAKVSLTEPRPVEAAREFNLAHARLRRRREGATAVGLLRRAVSFVPGPWPHGESQRLRRCWAAETTFDAYVWLARRYGMEQAVQRLMRACTMGRNALLERLKDGRRQVARKHAGQVDEGGRDIGWLFGSMPIPRLRDARCDRLLPLTEERREEAEREFAVAHMHEMLRRGRAELKRLSSTSTTRRSRSRAHPAASRATRRRDGRLDKATT